jgi:hypothetical protein
VRLLFQEDCLILVVTVIMPQGTTSPAIAAGTTRKRRLRSFATHEGPYTAFEQVIGSTPERLGRLAPCAVLVVK